MRFLVFSIGVTVVFLLKLDQRLHIEPNHQQYTVFALFIAVYSYDHNETSNSVQ